MIHRVEYITNSSDITALLKEERILADNALINALKADGHNDKELKDDLSIVNHHHLEHYANQVVSISHTANKKLLVGAAVIAKQSETKSIGIDIELSDRKINPKATKFFINKYDRMDNLEHLDIWTYKEAAFKALSPINEKITLLNHIWLEGNNFGIVGCKKIQGTIEKKIESINDQLLIVTLARITA